MALQPDERRGALAVHGEDGELRFSLYRDLLLLAKLLAMVGWARDRRVRSAVGVESRCAVAEGEPQPTSTGVGDLEPRGAGEDCDVAIVGSGAGGAAAAAILAEAGLDVMVLESGPYVDKTSYPTDPLDGLPLLYRDGGMTIAWGSPPSRFRSAGPSVGPP